MDHKSLSRALRGSGATVKIVTLSPKMGRTEVIRAMTGAGTDQSLLLSVSGRRTLTAPLVWSMAWNWKP